MKAEFIKSVYDFNDYKGFGLPEFAFAGRSNVGKSSLINCILNTRIAHTSKTPGKTRSINFYMVEKRFILTDLPGYGYAKVSNQEILRWKELVESYILKSKNLRMVFVLADIARGIEYEETMLLDWLKILRKPAQIVFTKIDRLSRSEMVKKDNELKWISPVYFSSKTKEGKKSIIKIIEDMLNKG